MVSVALAGVLGLLSVPVSRAQEGDPSDVWLRAYMVMREGEQKEEEKKYLEALSKFRESQRLFDFLARTHPQWKSNMITFRRKALLDKIEEVHGRLKGSDPAGEQQFRADNAGAVASVPPPPAQMGGITVPSNVEMQAPMPGAPTGVAPPPAAAKTPGGAPVESLSQEFKKLQDQMDQLTGANQRLIAEREQRQQAVVTLETQLEQSRQVEQQLRAQLTKALDDLKTAQNSGGERQRRLEEQLQLATAELRKANTESAGILKALEKAKQEAADLASQKNALLASREGEMEKAAQLMAELEQTAGDRDKARSERDAARAELKRLQEQSGTPGASAAGAPADAAMSADLAQRLEESERQNRELLAKLDAQLKSGDPALKARNEELVAELKKSEATMTSLHAKVKELEQEKAGLQKTNQQLLARQDQLTKERDLLRKERDEMAILLKASDQIKGEVKDIVEANTGWIKQLEEANRRTFELQEKEGNYRQEIDQLRGQLGALQQERDTLRSENNRYQETVAELNAKLEKMLAELDRKTKALEQLTAGGAAKGGPAVVAANGKTYTKEELESMAGAKEENELLRGIIREQLVQQAKAHTARQLVLQELEKMDFQSELLLTSLDDMAGQQIDISEEVKKMFKGRDEMKLIEVAEAAQASDKKFASLKTGKETLEQFPERVAPVVQDSAQAKELTPGAKKNHIIHLAKAANYDFTRGAYDAARKGYEQILGIEPNDVFALANMGLIHAQLGNPAKAKDYLERALKCDQTHAPTHYYLGLLHFKQGDYDAATEAFGKCLTQDRKNANAHFYLGMIATEKRRPARAEVEFLEAVKLDANHADAHFNLAVLYANRDKPDKKLAMKYYRRAKELGAAVDSAMEELARN